MEGERKGDMEGEGWRKDRDMKEERKTEGGREANRFE